MIYWQQLASLYLTMAGETTDPKAIHHLQLRTIVTMLRAQDHGLMNAAKDNLNLISLFFNLEQYSKAAELLSTELDSGKIENTRTNWEMLGLAYQQAGKENEAIHSLLKAADLFPTEGQLELNVSQLYYGDGNTEEAFNHLQKAAAKGNLKKPGAAYLFLGLTAYELQKFDEALKWAGAAAKEPDVKPEDAKRLARAATEALKEHGDAKHA
jgi:tetratricopeptide (TPR) repeat protein